MKNKTVLVIAAHPDDEILGCGGTMRRHIEVGDSIHCLILAEGITSREQNSTIHNQDALSDLATAARQANEIIGVSSLILHNFPDNRMDSLPLLSVVKVVEQFVDKLKPSIVYTHYGNDLNIDHRITSQAVVTACRPSVVNTVEKLLFFEVPSSTEWQIDRGHGCFHPNWFVDITNTLGCKVEALEAYASEMCKWPHPRSIKAVEHLAHWRGATAGCEAAEAFMLARYIEKEW